MLAAMRARSFVVVTAWTKTEPIQVALFGFAVLGDPLSTLSALAIALATVGVVFMSGKPSADQGAGNVRPAMLGLVSGAFFALSAIGFRGAILSLDSGSFILKASFTLSWSLGAQVCAIAMDGVVQSRPDGGVHAGLAGLVVGRFFRGERIASLVHWFCANGRRQRAYLGPARGLVRSVDIPARLFARNVSSRAFWYQPDRRGCGTIVVKCARRATKIRWPPMFSRACGSNHRP